MGDAAAADDNPQLAAELFLRSAFYKTPAAADEWGQAARIVRLTSPRLVYEDAFRLPQLYQLTTDLKKRAVLDRTTTMGAGDHDVVTPRRSAGSGCACTTARSRRWISSAANRPAPARTPPAKACRTRHISPTRTASKYRSPVGAVPVARVARLGASSGAVYMVISPRASTVARVRWAARVAPIDPDRRALSPRGRKSRRRRFHGRALGARARLQAVAAES